MGLNGRVSWAGFWGPAPHAGDHGACPPADPLQCYNLGKTEGLLRSNPLHRVLQGTTNGNLTRKSERGREGSGVWPGSLGFTLKTAVEQKQTKGTKRSRLRKGWNLPPAHLGGRMALDGRRNESGRSREGWRSVEVTSGVPQPPGPGRGKPSERLNARWATAAPVSRAGRGVNGRGSSPPRGRTGGHGGWAWRLA